MEEPTDISILENKLGNISESDNQIKKIVPSHENLWVWRKSFKLMLRLHEVSISLPIDERFRLKDQVCRSSRSVPDNIAEGVNSYYYNDKIKGFRHSRKEAGETQSHIREMQQKRYLSNDESESLLYEYQEVIKGLNGLVRYYTKKRDSANLKGH